jgi:hypothetical protein
MARNLTTADIGIAIRDALENDLVELLDWENNGDPHDDVLVAEIESVDVSDPHNPILYTEGGIFRVTITKIG